MCAWQWSTRIYLCGPTYHIECSIYSQNGKACQLCGCWATGMNWPVRFLIKWHTVTALNLHTLPCLDVKCFLYSGTVLLLRISNPCVLWLVWRIGLSGMLWLLRNGLFLLCCEILPAVILGMLGNTTHLNILISVKLEDWYAFTSWSRTPASFECCKTWSVRVFWRLWNSSNWYASTAVTFDPFV